MLKTELANLQGHAAKVLKPALEGLLSPAERLALFKKFIKLEEHHIRHRHQSGASGIEITEARAHLLDVLLQSLFSIIVEQNAKSPSKIALVAVGGYGRGTLNPSSDIDLLFLIPTDSHKVAETLSEHIKKLLYVMWDLGFKVGQSVRSIGECIDEAKRDPLNHTALLDARFLCGNEELFEKFTKRFEKDCISKNVNEFLLGRREDIRQRYEKYQSVFLQEPNVKESPGGLRDYHNLLWIVYTTKHTRNLSDLVEKGILTKAGSKELSQAFEFIHRVRNELHYHTGRATDILTLQLQGVLAERFEYPQKSILRKIETFMRDYYRHSRNIYNHVTSVFQIFRIEFEEEKNNGRGLRRRQVSEERFDGFIARNGFLYAESNDIFKEDRFRLIRLFLHCQERDLRLSPDMRKLFKAHWGDIDGSFRTSKSAIETFRAILEMKGQVARTLRRMHRVGFLGRYLPEFGPLDCLVQHEFFHRYTADEHTLRCIEQLDALLDSEHPATETFRKLFRAVEDPYALYIAILLHDAGRAENVREHIDGSAMLADRLCKRLKITGQRRVLIMFLIDHHLTLFRYATKKNIEDPHVIKEFSAQMRDQRLLDILLLFTYIDSKGTNEDSWSPWKESLILQLYRSASKVLSEGYESFSREFWNQMEPKSQAVKEILEPEDHALVDEHFRNVPKRYIRYRKPEALAIHIEAIRDFKQREQEQSDGSAYATKWIAHKPRGYSEMIIATRDQKSLLSKICCALSSQNLNILSADVYTRNDGIIVDVFRVQTERFEPVTNKSTLDNIEKALETLFSQSDYDASKFIIKKRNFLQTFTDPGVRFPTRAIVDNIEDEKFTIIEVQAIDRIGLLHDVFATISKYNLSIQHARIVTEKGAAMDTFYILTEDGKKFIDTAAIKQMEIELSEAAQSDKDL